MGLQERDGEAALVSSASINSLETDQEGRSTLIKLELPYSGAGVGLGDGDSYQDIDRCCPASNLSQWEDFVRVSLQSPGLYTDIVTSKLTALCQRSSLCWTAASSRASSERRRW